MTQTDKKKEKRYLGQHLIIVHILRNSVSETRKEDKKAGERAYFCIEIDKFMKMVI